ncbi:MAG: PilZ domain-containing protein [Oxalobacteraceae bacterium]
MQEPLSADTTLRPSVVSLAIRDRAALYAAYMPFLRHGGIFVPGTRPSRLGEEIFLLLTLMQDEQRYRLAGKVAWITPAGAGNHHTQGFGVHFPDDEAGRTLKKRIEELLGTSLGASRSTHTM